MEPKMGAKPRDLLGGKNRPSALFEAQQLVRNYLEACGGEGSGFIFGEDENRLANNIAAAFLRREKGKEPDPDEDFFVPIRVPNKVGVVLEVADADVEYVRKRLHEALGIPSEYQCHTEPQDDQ